MKSHLKTTLKIAISFCLLINSIYQAHSQSTGDGRVEARFGIDGDLTADTSLNGGGVLGIQKPADDWFKYLNRSGLTGIGVIDTTGSYKYKSIMLSSAAARTGLVFTQGMAVPKLTRSGSYILLDALYAKDYADNDKTIVSAVGGTKIIDNPNNWAFSTGSVPAKDDILEFYSHVRRKGITVKDSLFFYFGVGIYGNTGAKNVTAELFVNDVQYDTVNQKLTNLGSQGGRVAWQFNSAGDVVNIGDMIISMGYNGAFEIHPRIWMRRGTYDSFSFTAPLFLKPKNFLLGAFAAQTAGVNGYGYVDIEPLGGPSTQVALGSASGTAPSAAAPWGTIGSSSGFPYASTYAADQFVELSINLTALGVDPSSFTGIDPCTVPYRSIIFYSTSSTAANSNPKDFAGPYPFWRYPRVIAKIVGNDTLNCTKTSAKLLADSAYGLAWYKWTGTAGGHIIGYNADSTEITYDKGGQYILESAPLRGCFTKKDTITILQDTLQPIATAFAYDSLVLGSVYVVKLYGGDSAASVAATSSILYGPSKGIGFSWTGPLGYVATGMQPLANSMGTYKVTVTEIRNGCFDTASTWLVLLPVELSDLNCQVLQNKVQLTWHTNSDADLSHFIVERMTSNGLQVLGRINAKPNGMAEKLYYTFNDNSPSMGNNAYRITAIGKNGEIEGESSCNSRIAINNGGIINFFPIPAESSLYIDFGSEEVPSSCSIFDLAGNEIMKYHFDNPVENLQQINLKEIPSGMYILSLSTSNYSRQIKFLH